MFIFLSKLLPLFFYPLGMACFLIVLAIVLFWKHPRWSAGSIALALTILLIFSNGWIAQNLMRSLESQNLPPVPIPQADAIVVLGGGVYPALPPRSWVEVNEAGDRILYGSQLYRQGKAPWLILSGGRIDWKKGGPPESADMAKIAETMGVTASAILQDPTSLNTYQNAVNVKKILDDRGIKGPILLVTSAFHLPRSLLIFKHLGIKTIPAPTDFSFTQQDIQASQNTWQAVLLNLFPDVYNLQQSTKALKEYIGLAIYRLRGWI